MAITWAVNMTQARNCRSGTSAARDRSVYADFEMKYCNHVRMSPRALATGALIRA